MKNPRRQKGKGVARLLLYPFDYPLMVSILVDMGLQFVLSHNPENKTDLFLIFWTILPVMLM